MKPITKREILLNEKLIALLQTTSAELQKLQEEMNAKREVLSNVLTGACLNEGVDVTTEGIYFSDDLTVAYIYDLPKKEEDAKEPKLTVSKGKKTQK